MPAPRLGSRRRLHPAASPPSSSKLEAIGGQPNNAAGAAKNSGFADQNSGLGPASTTLGGNDTTINGAATNAVNNANTSLRRPTLPPTPMPPAGGGGRGPGN